MPNTNKPSRKRAVEDEEEEQSSSDDDSGGITSYSYRPPHGGGKQLRPAPAGGGKMLRMPVAEDYDEDEDDENDDEEHSSDSSSSDENLYAVTTQTHPHRSSGGGKQLRMPSGGKQLRITPQEEEEESDEDDDQSDGQDSSEDEVEEQTQPSSFVVSRPGGGKSLANMRPPPIQENSEDESSAASEKVCLPSRPQGGGKSLANMQRQPIDKDLSEEEDDEEETPSPQSAFRLSGGKSLNNMQRSRGKQLTVPHNRNQQQSSSDSNEDDDDESETSEVSREYIAPQTGKMFRPPGGGKILRLPNSFSSGQASPPKDVPEKEPMFSDVDEEDIEKKPQSSKSTNVETADIAASNADKGDIDSMEMSESDSSGEEGIGAAPWASASKTTLSKTVVMSESEASSEQSSSSDEEEDELDVDKMDPSVLIKDDDDHEYLQSLPEFEREAILGERFEKLKNERDMKKALRDAKRQDRDRKKLLQAQSTIKSGKKASSSKTQKKKDAGTPIPAKAKLPGKIPSGDEHTVGKSKIRSKEDEETREVDGLETVQAMAESPVDRMESAQYRDSTSLQEKKAAARAAIREDRFKRQEQDDNKIMDTGESDDDLDYGSSDDDSEEDYTERPWGIGAVKKDSNKVTASKEAKWKDSIVESDTSEKEEEEGGTASRPIVEATFDDYKAICLPRRRLARWCNEPFFEKAVVNSYIRLGIGADEETKKMVYRFCKILGVETKREYSFPKAPNQKRAITTSKWLKVEFGKHINYFRMITISDSPPEEAEVMKYIHQLKNSRKQALSKSQARRIKSALIDTVNNYQYTKDDIDRVVQEKKKNIVARNIGLEKTRIEIEVLAASEALTEAQNTLNGLQKKSSGIEPNEGKIVIAQNNVIEAQKKLDLILAEKQRIVDADEMRKRKIMMSSKVQNWVKVNQRAKEKNRAADYLSYKGHSKQRVTSKEFDPFARRKVKPDILWEVGKGENKDVRQVDSEMAVTENVSSSKLLAAADDNMHTSQHRENENKKKMEYLNSQKELIGKRHQFAIDEEVLARTSSRLNGVDMDRDHYVGQDRIRRGLSLAEYQERKASGRL